MRRMKAFLLGALLALAPLAAFGQVPSTVPPYNTDLGAIITCTSCAAGADVSAAQSNLDGQGLSCVGVVTGSTSGTSLAFKIQGYDAATTLWYDIAASGSITTLNAATPLIVKPGIVAADAVSPAVAKSIPVPRTWRISRTFTGGSAWAAVIGCNKLK